MPSPRRPGVPLPRRARLVRVSVRTRAPGADEDIQTEEPVTPLELFFDLVFVFAVTQVTTLLSGHPTWGGVAQAVAVLSVLWWAWESYAWLTNSIDPEEGLARFVVFAAMAAFFVAALAVPRAFGRDALVFGVAYAVLRGLHLVLYLLSSAEDPSLRGAIVRLARPAVVASALLLGASALHGAGRSLLWAGAIAVDWVGLLLVGQAGWRVHPGHFAERHAGVIIIALGESVAAVGVGAHGLRLDLALVVATLLGIGTAIALWWAYFDVVALVAERRFRESRGLRRVRVARDSYTLLHFPMVAGIVIFAFGARMAISAVHRPLDLVPAAALGGGVALYLAAHVAFRLRNLGTVNRQRCVAAVACLAAIPAERHIQALLALALISAICLVLVAYEAVRFADVRARVRAQRAPG